MLLALTWYQWFKAAHGIRATGSPRAVSFCAHAILGEETMVVPDALVDERFHDSPLVVSEPFIRFYAGQPLRAADGSKVGSFCVMDTRPRQPSEADLETLRYLALWVEDELQVKLLSEAQSSLIAERDELRRRSMLDPLTRTWNRDAILEVLGRELARAARDRVPLSLMMADVDHFKGVNDSLGHPAGDAVLLGVVRNLRAALRPYDAIGRYGGEEFLIVLPHCANGSALRIAERMRKKVAAERIVTAAGEVSVTLSLGLTTTAAQPADGPEGLVEAADRALYQAKAAGRNRVVIAS